MIFPLTHIYTFSLVWVFPFFKQFPQRASRLRPSQVVLEDHAGHVPPGVFVGYGVIPASLDNFPFKKWRMILKTIFFKAVGG